MKYFIIYSIIFIIVFILYRLYFIIREKYKSKTKILEIFYLESKYKLKFNKDDMNSLYTYISIVNSLILTLAYYIFNMNNILIWQIIITIVSVFVLIYTFYAILGNYLKNKR